MKTLRKTAVLALLAAASIAGMAAETADLSVKGVIRPAACQITLGHDGTVDYGTISATTLNQSAPTVLGDRTLPLTISCDAATTFGVIIPDGRPGTVADGMETALNSQNLHGLGAVGGRSLGAFTLMFSAPTVDGETGITLESPNGTTWREYDGGVTPGLRYMTAWGVSGATTPSAIKDLTTDIRVRTGVAAKDDLPDISSGVALDGLVTIELRYL